MGETEDLAAATAKLKEAEAEAEKWKAMSRKNEERAKENADAADKLKKLEESSLSDQQKREAAETAQAGKLADLEKRADEADARALRAEVASAKKLTPAQAKRLAGTTREELEADADDLLETFKPESEQEPEGEGGERKPAGRPKEDLKGGTDPTSSAVETNPAKLAESVPRI